MSETRPDPDALLAQVTREESSARRGRLKIFLGASAGVGKTYAMLTEAHELRRAGRDVVVGLIETHGRAETAALLAGLESLPRRSVEHRGTQVSEFDIDAALVRRPQLVLVDELAHTNAAGSRHRKRWLDVYELLESGIDVHTTLNVQHIESLIDVVAQVTGVTVRETVPDSVLDRADEIELVDLPPDDLLQRLREGKVYVAEQAGRALESFFRKGNLIALRELAMRQAAQRVDAQMETYRRASGIAEPWAVRERILVCVGNAEHGLRLVRAARRMAAGLKAEWIVVHVETPGRARDSRAQRDALVDLLGLAEDLGADTAIVTGLRVADELLHLARERHVSRIVVGKPRAPWRVLLPGTLLQRLLAEGGDVDVHVLAGEDAPSTPAPPPQAATPPAWRPFLGALPVVITSTLLAWAMYPHFELTDLAMVELLGVTIVAVAFGRGPAIASGVLSVLLFDFLFVPPRFQFAVSDVHYLVTFVVMLFVAMVIGTLAAHTREQAGAARARERRTAALYQLSRELGAGRSAPLLFESAAARIRDVFEADAALLEPGATGNLALVAGEPGVLSDGAHEIGVAQWAFDHAQPAGLGTDTLPASRALHLPLLGASGDVLGVLAVRPSEAVRITSPDRLQLLQAFANQTAVALERARLSEQAERARVEAQAERARNALLSSVSHDLRTPLAVITGAATSLRDSGPGMSPATRQELAETIADEGERLNRLVGDLLDMTRLESGTQVLRREWHAPEEVVGAAVARARRAAGGRAVDLRCDPGLPLVALDDVLYGQAIVHLVENALQYAPAQPPVEVRVTRAGEALRVEVADRGPGFAPGEEERVFEKFYRGAGGASRRGTGLGLAICRAIAEAHGGRVHAAPRPGGGALFTLEIPLGGEPPAIEREGEELA